MTRLALLGLVVLSGIGCSSFDRLDFRFDSAPPSTAEVTFEQISLEQGVAVAVQAVPLDESGDVMDDETRVELESDGGSALGVLQARPGPEEDDDEIAAHWHFVLFGVSEGSAWVRVRIDGEEQAPIAAEVLPPATD